MRRAWIDPLFFRLPARCEVCGAWPSRPVCDSCLHRFACTVPRCETCALGVAEGVARCGRCLRSAPVLDGCHAAVAYGFPWAGLIGRFKFQQQPGWAAHLAALMRRSPAIDSALAACDLVLPMPLSRRRLAERGFNQAVELARRLAPSKLATGLLLRVRDTPPQAQLDREQRHTNLRHAFAVAPQQAPTLRGRNVVLLDDVMTSGASLEAAAEVLRRAGCARITGVVLARTEEA